MERPDVKRYMGVTSSQQVEYNSIPTSFLKELWQLGIKETISSKGIEALSKYQLL